MKILGKKRIIALGCFSLVLLAGIVYTSLFYRFVKVPTGAMMNTILPGDRLMVDTKMSLVSRGDIVIFKFPKELSTQLVKRIVGLPGETVLVDGKANKVFVNDRELDEHRIMVQSQLNNDDASSLTPVNDEGGSLWKVYYNQLVGHVYYPDAAGESLATEPFKIPIKGNSIPEELGNDKELR